MANKILRGSICLSDIPKELIKQVPCRDGKVRAYLNISIIERKQPATYSNNGVERNITHFISCAPRKEERKDGVQYILGDIETKVFGDAPMSPTPEQIESAPIFGMGDSSQVQELPF